MVGLQSLLLLYLCQGGFVFGAVCLLVCLSEFKQDCAKHTGLISMKSSERLLHEARKNQFNFGVDLLEISLAFFPNNAAVHSLGLVEVSPQKWHVS